MFGSILKYTAVALAGAVAFTTSAFFMDADVVEAARKEAEDHAATLSTMPTDDFKIHMASFINANRSRWIASLTFTRSIEDLDAALAQWQ